VSSLSINTDTWYWVEGYLKIGQTDGRAIIKVDGITFIDYTGWVTYNSGTVTSFDSISTGHFTGVNTCYIDDFYMATSAGGQTYLGDSRIITLKPNADTADEDWTLSTGTDSYALLNDAFGEDDTTYIDSPTATDKTVCGYTDLPAGEVGTIHGVTVTTRAKKDDVNARTMRSIVISNAVQSNGVTFSTTQDTYEHRHDAFPLNPDGSVAWTPTTVNAITAGVEVIS
jgi:hypothetical protein